MNVFETKSSLSFVIFCPVLLLQFHLYPTCNENCVFGATVFYRAQICNTECTCMRQKLSCNTSLFCQSTHRIAVSLPPADGHWVHSVVVPGERSLPQPHTHRQVLPAAVEATPPHSTH